MLIQIELASASAGRAAQHTAAAKHLFARHQALREAADRVLKDDLGIVDSVGLSLLPRLDKIPDLRVQVGHV